MDSNSNVELSPGLLKRLESISSVSGMPSFQYLQNSLSEFARPNSRIQNLVVGSFSGLNDRINEIVKVGAGSSGLNDRINEIVKVGAGFSGINDRINEIVKVGEALAEINARVYAEFRPLREASFGVSGLRLQEEVFDAFQSLADGWDASASSIVERIAEFSLETDQEFTRPVNSEVILDLNGAPREAIARIEIASPAVRILRNFIATGASFAELSWREFEYLVAGLLERDGFEVEVGRGTKDNGVDIFARKEIPGFGRILSVWQAKHYQKKAVGIGAVRELADTRVQSGATKGIIVTSSRLSRDAIKRINRDEYTLHKVEGTDLEGWLRRTTSPLE